MEEHVQWHDLVHPGVIPPVQGWGCLLAGLTAPKTL